MNMKQQVTATSIQAYRSLDHTTLRGRIGGWIVDQSRIGKSTCIPVSIRKIAEHFNIDRSTASARLNELKKGTFMWDGQHYRLEFAGKAIDSVTMITVETWRAVPAHDPGQQNKLF